MRFRVKAVRGQAEVVDLAIDALDAANAASRARDQGYAVLGVRRASAWRAGMVRAGGGLRVLGFTQGRIARRGAGRTLVAAIGALAEKEASAPARQVLDGILERLQRGAPFSGALEDFPLIFPPLYVATVRSNERTGGLAESLAR